MNILIKIKKYNNLSEAENTVREYILKHPNQFLLETVREIAKKTYTSPATVVRFCKKINQQGVQRLKIDLAKEIDSYTNMQKEFEDSTIINPEDSFDNIKNKLSETSKDSIIETQALMDETTIKKVAELIYKSKVIDLYGSGASNLVAIDASYKFMRINKLTQCYQLFDRQIVQALNSNETHIAIIFSFTGETKEMIEIAKILQENNIDIVAVIGTIGSTLQKYSEYPIFFNSKETTFRSGAMSSRIAQLYVVDLIYMMVSLIDNEKTNLNIVKTRLN